MKILITGANGYLGARMSQYLSFAGYEIIALTKSQVKSKEGWSSLIKKNIVGNLTDNNILNELVSVGADIVIHLASLDRENSEKSVDNALNVNVEPTWQLLEKYTKVGLKKFIYFSTVHVLGNNIGSKTINDPLPLDNYGLTHLLCEKLCLYYDNKTETDCTILRLANSYGEPIFRNNKCWSLLINNLVKTAFFDHKIILNSRGEEKRSFIHFSDICNYIGNFIVENKRKHRRLINFDSNKYYKSIDIAIAVQSVYLNRYKRKIPIYINKNQLFEPLKKSKIILKKMNEPIIQNKSKLEINKNIFEGINDLFLYFDSNS